jgi:hypothetical protein
MRGGTSRDGRRQSRLLRGTRGGFTYRDDSHEVGTYMHEDKAYDHDKYFRVYQPQFDDQCYISEAEGEDETCLMTPDPITEDTVAWWKLGCGRVLGVVNGMMLEFDKSTLAPLGLVVSGDMLLGKRIAIVDSGLEECAINFDDDGMDGAECVDGPESANDDREQVSVGCQAMFFFRSNRSISE